MVTARSAAEEEKRERERERERERARERERERERERRCNAVQGCTSINDLIYTNGHFQWRREWSGVWGERGPR